MTGVHKEKENGIKDMKSQTTATIIGNAQERENWPTFGSDNWNANSDDGKQNYYGNRGESNNNWRQEVYWQVRQEGLADASEQYPMEISQDDRGLSLEVSDPDQINSRGGHRKRESNQRQRTMANRQNDTSTQKNRAAKRTTWPTRQCRGLSIADHSNGCAISGIRRISRTTI